MNKYNKIDKKIISPEKKVLKKRIRKINRKKIFLNSLLLFSFLLVMYYFLPISKIKNINITNNTSVNTTKILKDLNLKTNDSFFSINSIIAEWKLKNNPLIDSVKVSKNIFTNSLDIVIEKSDYLLYYFNDNNLYLVNSTGTIKEFKKYDFINFGSLIKINKPSNLETLKGLAKKIKELPQSFTSIISEIDIKKSEVYDNLYYFYIIDGNTIIANIENINSNLAYYSEIATSTNGEKGYFIFENAHYFRKY